MARQTAPITACLSHDRGINVGVSDCHQNRSATDEPVIFSQELATVSVGGQDRAATLAQTNAHGAGALAAGSERHLVSVGEKRTRLPGWERQRLRTSRDFEEAAECPGRPSRDGAAAQQIAGAEVAAVH